MRSKTNQWSIMITLLLTIFFQACGGSAPQAVQPSQTTALDRTSTPVPTITTLPTYTPLPKKTITPTTLPQLTSTPASTEMGAPSPTQLVNCIPSSTPGYITCTDDTNSIKVDVPDSWSDINGSTWTYKGVDIGVAISAAPSLETFPSSFNVEGVFFGASRTFAEIIGHIELLDFYTTAYEGNCTYDGRFDYNDGVYRGKYDKYSSCGGTEGYDAYVLGAREITEPSTRLILVEIQVAPGDTSTVNQILATFYVFF